MKFRGKSAFEVYQIIYDQALAPSAEAAATLTLAIVVEQLEATIREHAQVVGNGIGDAGDPSPIVRSMFPAGAPKPPLFPDTDE